MKKLIGLMLAVMMLAVMACAAMAEEQGTVMYVYTRNGKGLNVRSSMSTKDDTNVVANLAYGTKVFTYGSPQSGWTYIDLNNVSGPCYVMSRYLVRSKPAPFSPTPDTKPDSRSFDTRAASTVEQINTLLASAKQVAPYTVTVQPTRSSGWVYMRWTPSRNSKQVASFGANQQLTVLAELKDWYQVQDANGRVGFVYKSYIQ